MKAHSIPVSHSQIELYSSTQAWGLGAMRMLRLAGRRRVRAAAAGLNLSTLQMVCANNGVTCTSLTCTLSPKGKGLRGQAAAPSAGDVICSGTSTAQTSNPRRPATGGLQSSRHPEIIGICVLGGVTGSSEAAPVYCVT
jgi:hypothetical protein